MKQTIRIRSRLANFLNILCDIIYRVNTAQIRNVRCSPFICATLRARLLS